jgi:hypothetical protein
MMPTNRANNKYNMLKNREIYLDSHFNKFTNTTLNYVDILVLACLPLPEVYVLPA